MHVWSKVVLGLCLAMATTVASADTVTISVDLGSHETGYYRLVGQSAFIQTRTDSSTSGGQLDFLESGDSQFSFDEVFPPDSLADYLGFAYFGIVETVVAATDTVVDTSLVIAYLPGFGVGELVSDTFPYDASTLVTAFTTEFDSAEFLDMLGLVPANATTLGDIAVPPLGRPGTTMDLIAFFDGGAGVKIGTLYVSVPEPSTLALLATAGVGLLVLRRRTR